AGVTLQKKFSQANKQEVQKAKEQRSKREQLMHMYRLAKNHFASNLAGEAGKECRAYMQKRGISDELMKRFGLGWARDDWHDLSSFLQAQGCSMPLAVEGGLVSLSKKTGKPYDPFRARLMFPIRNTAGETIAFGGRIIDNGKDEAKYINTHDTPIYKKGEHLYGLDLAGKAIRISKSVFLTEGYMDVLTLHQFGYENAVGGLGTALTDQQVQRILGFSPQIMLLYDGDNAGRKAALSAAGKFLSRGAKVRVILQPEGEDIDSLLRTQGKEAFEKLCAASMPGLRFCVETMRTFAPRDALEWCRTLIKSMSIPELVSPTITYLARWLNFDETELRAGIGDEMDKQPQASAQGRDSLKAAQSMSTFELEIIRCAIRYPDHIADIQAMSADLMLKSSLAKDLWNKIAKDGIQAGYELTGQERQLWDRYRGLEAPPCTTPDIELAVLKKQIDKHLRHIQRQSLSAVLRQNDAQGDFGSGMQILNAMGSQQDTAEQNQEQGTDPGQIQ
ncbi:MAG: toprim domain-containing protein, partial [Desulfovibrionaceae bacterium]|nr:toprim domain-containing protein [Desulfovibrionaceae bacterium]